MASLKPDPLPDAQHDLEIECAVLGAILNGAEVPAGLQPEDFYHEPHRRIFGACKALADDGNPTIEDAVVHYLRNQGGLRSVGGAAYVSSLTRPLPNVAALKYFAGLIRKDSRDRKAMELGARLHRGDDPKKISAKLQRIIETTDEGEVTPEKPTWPILAPEALYGLAGEIVAAIEPHTESDPVAILAQFLIAFGSCAGRGPHFMVEADRHGCNGSVVLVGRTSRARKGTSWRHVQRLLEAADPNWTGNCTATGLSSGEGLIWAVRDSTTKLVPAKDGPPEEVVVDRGVSDKRLLVIESEYASPLKMISRRGNTLSPMIRDAWDGYSLRSLVKNSPARATDPHISVLGHITEAELRTHLAETEVANGYGNRVLWLCVRRSKILPEGGSPDEAGLSSLIRKLKSALGHARRVGELRRSPEARAAWCKVYPELSTDHPGLLGAMIARAEAHVTRLSMLYALLDESKTIEPDHLVAALAFWQYAEDSAKYIFGEALGDPVADRLLELIQASPDGMTQTALHNALGNHASACRISTALKQLEGLGKVVVQKRRTGGRPALVWRPVGGR